MSKTKTERTLLKELLEKGYGEDERKKWRERYRRNLKARLEMQKKRKNKPAESSRKYEHEHEISNEHNEDNPEASETTAYNQKPEETYNHISSKLRRKIDSYAYRNNYKTTKLKERILSFFTFFNPGIKDFANEDLIEILIKGKGFKNEEPEKYCLLDNIDALFYASGFLLGYYRSFSNSIQRKEVEDNVKKIHTHIRNKLPYGIDFLKVFRERDEGLIRILELIKIKFKNNSKIHITKLSRVVRYIYALSYKIGGIETERLNNILFIISEINKAHETKTAHYKQIDYYSSILKTAYGNLKIFKHELFPSFLKLIGAFFTEKESMKKENLIMIYRALDIREQEIIHDKILIKNMSGQPEIKNRLKQKKKDEEENRPVKPFSQTYWNTLFTLKNLFFGSGIENIEQWSYIVPYFDLKIFTKNLPFYEHIQYMNRFDPMGQIMTFHRIIDNMLSSLNFYEIDQILDRKGELNEELIILRKEWQLVYNGIFAPYLRELNNYLKTAGNNTDEKIKDTLYSKKLQEELNQLKNLAIKNYGNIIIGLKTKVPVPSLRVFKLAKNLYEILHDIYKVINIDLITKKDKNANEILSNFEEKMIINFELNEEIPVIKKIKELIESQLNTPITDIPMKSQLVFFEIFVSISNMYEYLLNNENSFYRNIDNNRIIAGKQEQMIWEKTKEDISVSLAELTEN